MSVWIDKDIVTTRLKDEAARDAKRLGHRITSWVAQPGTSDSYTARCVVCLETASVMVRRFRAAPIAGVAVSLQCRPKKAA
jgi:hypothetical protein